MPRLLRIMRGGELQRGNFGFGQRSDDACRDADDQAPGLKYLAFRDQRSSADDTLRANHRTIQDPRTHADQRLILDRAAVEDRLVPDRDPGADGERSARVRMADRAVLKVTVGADDDRRGIEHPGRRGRS